jgi:hypothetical protein
VTQIGACDWQHQLALPDIREMSALFEIRISIIRLSEGLPFDYRSRMQKCGK